MTTRSKMAPSRANGCLQLLSYFADGAVLIFMAYRQIKPIMGIDPWTAPAIAHVVLTAGFVIIHAGLRHTRWIQIWKPRQRQPFNIWIIVSVILMCAAGIVAVNHPNPLAWDSPQALLAIGLFVTGVVMWIRQH